MSRQPSDAELKKFYDAHPDMFRAAGISRLHAGEPVTPADLAATIKIPDGQAEERLRPAQGRFRPARTARGAADPRAFRREGQGGRGGAAGGKDWNDVGDRDRRPGPRRRSISASSSARICRSSWPMPRSTCRSTSRAQPIKPTLGWHILRVVKIVAADDPELRPRPRRKSQG